MRPYQLGSGPWIDLDAIQIIYPLDVDEVDWSHSQEYYQRASVHISIRFAFQNEKTVFSFPAKRGEVVLMAKTAEDARRFGITNGTARRTTGPLPGPDAELETYVHVRENIYKPLLEAWATGRNTLMRVGDAV